MNPSHGYRAVHVIVEVDRRFVEVQVRTEWQHLWAEVFEKMADVVGRGIRYGRGASLRTFPSGDDADELVNRWRRLGEHFEAVEQGEARGRPVGDTKYVELRSRLLSQVRDLLEDLSTMRPLDS